MTNKVLLACRRSLRNGVKCDHCMIKFPPLSNANSTTLKQGRLKPPSLTCTFTLEVIVVQPPTSKGATLASAVIFRPSCMLSGVTIPRCTRTFHKVPCLQNSRVALPDKGHTVHLLAAGVRNASFAFLACKFAGEVLEVRSLLAVCPCPPSTPW